MNINRSIRKLTLMFVALFILLSAGLVYWQVIVASQVVANPHNGRPCINDTAPIRGRIFDRNGVLLADSQPVDPNNPPKVAVCGYVRHYYEPSLAGLIGYYISPVYSSSGIELKYNDYLNGQVGLTGLDNTVNKVLHRAPVGNDIYLTIDVRIQRIVDRAFDADTPTPDFTNVFPTNRGSVIVSDPHTGEILAMLSRPGYDPNRVAMGDIPYFTQLEHNPSQPLLERALSGQYVPGSIYKTVTLMAGLDSKMTTLDQPFDRTQALGPVFINGQKFGPDGNNIVGYTHNFPVDTRYAFAHSDNIIYAQIGKNMGANTWLDYNSRFYVGKDIPFDLPVPQSTVMPQGVTDLSTNQLAANAFGQGTDFITPIQMSLFDNAVANNGHLMRPAVVYKIVDRGQKPTAPFDSQELGTPISADTATQVRNAMAGVVSCGSGRSGFVNPDPKLSTSPWAVVAKTGTGQVGGGKAAQSWLLSQAPYQDPQFPGANPQFAGQQPKLTIVGMKENGGEGASAVGPMVGDMYNTIFAQVMKIQPPAPTNDNQLGTYCGMTKLLQQ